MELNFDDIVSGKEPEPKEEPQKVQENKLKPS